MEKDVYLSLSEAKKHVGKGFNPTVLKIKRNDSGTSLGYLVSDLDSFIEDRKISKEKKLENKMKKKLGQISINFKCSQSEFKEIDNFKKIHGIRYRDLVLRIVRNANKSPEFLALFK